MDTGEFGNIYFKQLLGEHGINSFISQREGSKSKILFNAVILFHTSVVINGEPFKIPTQSMYDKMEQFIDENRKHITNKFALYDIDFKDWNDESNTLELSCTVDFDTIKYKYGKSKNPEILEINRQTLNTIPSVALRS